MSSTFFNICIVGKRKKNHGAEYFYTGCTRTENIKTLNSLRHIFPEIRRATLLRLLKLAVNTYRPFVAIWLSWRLRYRRPIPKAYTHTPWLRKASAGLRTRSCEMPSVMTTRAWKENRNRCHWVSLTPKPGVTFLFIRGARRSQSDRLLFPLPSVPSYFL